VTVYDAVILAIIAAFALWGFWRGFIRETAETAGLILGALAGWHWSPALGRLLPPHSLPLMLRTAVAFLAILAAVFIGAAVLGWMGRKLLSHGPMKLLDRVGGFLFGGVKGAVVVIALAVLILFSPWGSKLLPARLDKHSLILGWTMRFARPIEDRCSKAMVSAVGASVVEMLKEGSPVRLHLTIPNSASHISAPTEPDSVQIPEKITLDLSHLDPDVDRMLRQVLKDPALAELGLGAGYEDLRSAGVSRIEIALDGLTPEARLLAKSLLDSSGSVRRMLEDLSAPAGSNLDSLLKGAGRDVPSPGSPPSSP
jgi:membrane protein required for colicin V production